MEEPSEPYASKQGKSKEYQSLALQVTSKGDLVSETREFRGPAGTMLDLHQPICSASNYI